MTSDDLGRTLVIGLAVVSVTRHSNGDISRMAGGDALETAIGLRRLGESVELLTCISPDSNGMAIVYRSIDCGVEITPASFVTEQSSASDIFEFDNSPSASTHGPESPVWRLRALGPGENLHVTTLSGLAAPGSQPLVELMQTARYVGRRVTFDAAIDDASIPDRTDLADALETAAAASTFLHVTEAALRRIYPEWEIGAAVDHLADCGADVVAVTSGAADILLQAGRKRVQARPSSTLAWDATARGCALASLIRSASTVDSSRPRKRDLVVLRDRYWSALSLEGETWPHPGVALAPELNEPNRSLSGIEETEHRPTSRIA
jgi:sugar/nucleoside kinase (ribokinase family)